MDERGAVGRLERRLAREQAARAEAEAIAERVTADQFNAMNELLAARAVLDETPDYVAIADPHGRASYLNSALREMLGLHRGDVATVLLPELLTPLSRERYEVEALPAVLAKGVWRGEFALVRPAGVEIPVSQVLIGHKDEAGALRHLSFVARDVSEQKGLTDLLAHRSLHDALTQLPNRLMLFDRLDMAIARAAGAGHPWALLFLDLDGFKQVNDQHGHDTGDAVLVAVASRLQSQMRARDLLARVGGDEFVLLCESVTGEEQATHIAARLINAVHEPIELPPPVGQVQVGLSVGIAYAASAGAAPHELVNLADQAMYDAKRAGKGRFHLVRVSAGPGG